VYFCATGIPEGLLNLNTRYYLTSDMRKQKWYRNLKIVSLLIVCVVLAGAGLQSSIAELLSPQRKISAYGVLHTSRLTVGVDIWWGTTASKFVSQGHASRMQECGIEMVRLQFDSSSVANLRTLVPVVVDNGIQVLGLLFRTDLAPDNEDAWGDWVYSVVNEFKQYIKVWEIWNEPNLDKYFSGKDPVKYTNFLKRAYTEAKRADPTCFILGGSIVFTHNTALNFLRAVYDNGGRDYMDALSYHPYCDPYAPTDTSSTPNPYIYLTRVRDVMVDYGEQDKTIWITEVGWSANEDGQVGDEKQAQYLTEALEIARDWGWVETIIIYNWKDSATEGSSTKGLLRGDLSPKPSFYAVQSFTTPS